ncbi:Non-repetitive/WGA-negative nucleoporin C-terminal-domain-containing protein [Kalaharituber pfeilii]|nr:Non-repetitive/WGA-negative nucleoporin C-terminal-domain-containing protein [Kalaharituber pfeilii]
MFSPQVPPSDASRTRTRVRRAAPKQGHQVSHSREGSVTSVGQGKQVKEEPTTSRARKGRKEEGPATDKVHEDESIVWTKNAKYSVSLLPALPDCLRNPGSIIGVADPRHRHALILNHTSAWVWNYTDTHSLPHTYLFMLPQDESPYSTRDTPFPLGSLVSPSANSEEPGLVVVMPMTGRIAYWEAVGSAAAEGLFAKRRGVEGRLQLSQGETVTAVCNIEPAGFLLSLSSGHLAHLALRDAAGRPGITVTALRESSFMSGIFGALRSGSHRRDLVAVRAGRVCKMGEREIVVATARGGFSKWYVQRGGNYETKPEVDLRESIIRAVEKAAPHAARRNKEQFCVLDMAIALGSENEVIDQEEQDIDLFVLVGYVGPDEDSLYALLELKLTPSGRGDVKAVHPISCYTTPIEGTFHSRPRVYIPKPRNTAFIVFTRAVVILSNLNPTGSGERRAISEGDMDVDRQLLQEEEEEERKAVFEDVIDFRGDVNIDIVGSGGEDILFESLQREGSLGHVGEDIGQKRTVNPGVVLIARGAGVLRIEAFDIDERREKPVIIPREMMVKSKLEQAVFFGHIKQNPLNFSGRKEVRYPLEEVETAALQISHEIVSTSSTYITPMLPSMERHLELRGQRLKALAEHLRGTYKPLSPATRWKLLQDAEKIEAAKAIWINYDDRHTYESGGNEILLHAIQQDIPELEHQDPVRTWFQKHVEDIGELMRYTKKVLKEKTYRGKRDASALAAADCEANDIVLSGLQAAFNFRINSAGLYGFDGLIDEKGILINSKDYPDPWTSPLNLLHALDDQYDFSITLLKAGWGGAAKKGQNAIDMIAAQMEDLAELLCRVFLERLRWLDQQDSIEFDKPRADVKERYEKQRGGWIKPLVQLGRTDAAYNIAEKYQDFKTLVELASAELIHAETAAIEGLDEDQLLKLSQQKADAMKRLETYLERFKAPFAMELYKFQVENGKFKQLLEQFPNFQTYLTKFLRSSDKYAKLSWINDISLQEYDRAGDTLVQIALNQEESLWNKKVELNIGKLCKLAAFTDSDAIQALESFKNWQGEALTLIEIQEQLYNYLQPLVRGAIDKQAETEIILKEKGKTVGKRLITKTLFTQALNQLFNQRAINPELLIDLLTLMDGTDDKFPQYYFALQVLKASGLSGGRKFLAEQSIWRRCYIHDDWIAVHDTKKKSDEDVKDEVRGTALYQTILRAQQQDLFEQPNVLRIWTPSETIFSENTDELRVRFTQSDDVELTSVMMDMAQENKILNRFIGKANLPAWFEAARALVREDIDADSGAAEDDEDVEMS